MSCLAAAADGCIVCVFIVLCRCVTAIVPCVRASVVVLLVQRVVILIQPAPLFFFFFFSTCKAGRHQRDVPGEMSHRLFL